ncbi:MAG: glycoside hydrolase family 20 zincin-like fold domain-containing protein [Alistipes sp.]|nr:glycoside hydrolase family 20 zincin-like fold domain-containing protein [Alistipes sp.]
MRNIFLLAALVFICSCCGRRSDVYRSIVPQPFSIEMSRGTYTLPDTIVFVIPDNRIIKTVEDFASILIPRHRIDIVPDGDGDVLYILGYTGLGDGGYVLQVEPDRISVTSETLKGLRLGTDALRQSVNLVNPRQAGNVTSLPCAIVTSGTPGAP